MISLSTQFNIAVIEFLISYRRTSLGPLWLLVGPSLFVIILGALYSEIGAVKPVEFVPHLSIGLVLWTFISGVIVKSGTIYQRKRPQIMQGVMPLPAIVNVDIFSHLFIVAHQAVIVIGVLLYFQIPLSLYSLTSLIGFALIIANGIWTTRVFGILGVRYRDINEIFQAVMRIAFLATPIIWMPGDFGRGAVMDTVLVFNPFYHFIELVRAPLLGNPVTLLNWTVVLAITAFGYVLAHFMMRRYNKLVPLWL